MQSTVPQIKILKEFIQPLLPFINNPWAGRVTLVINIIHAQTQKGSVAVMMQTSP